MDGALYNDHGYRKLAKYLADSIFGNPNTKENLRSNVHNLVMEKNFYWLNDFKVPNGVHVYGRRYNPFGPQNYPFEIEKTREYTAIRDQAIWATLKGKKFDTSSADAKTSKLPEVPINYLTPDKNSKNGNIDIPPDRKRKPRYRFLKGIKSSSSRMRKPFLTLPTPCNLPSIIKVDFGSQLWPVTLTTGSVTPSPLIS